MRNSSECESSGLEMEHGTVLCRRRRGIFRKPGLLTVLDDFSIKILPGECVGLVGTSGCGKSTVGRCLAGLQKLHRGRILLRGTPLEEMRRKEFHGAVQMVFQSPAEALDPRQTVHAAIAEPISIHFRRENSSRREDRIRQLMGAVYLDADLLWRKPAELSGGQRQRVAIARALAVCPEYLICDEVVSALDAAVRTEIVELLRAMQRSNHLGILFISHDLSVVRRLCSRVVSMEPCRLQPAVNFSKTPLTAEKNITPCHPQDGAAW
ncbi:MAG: dipeptide/oligopeptide/nickel ABC transporter ATP-binding protein [Puniceicoccales bacterium]|nr:dipeptide/oligopeptide/nickel ABC transporter ATP-binding protein [Puniceicoccales bacterium]